MLLELARGSLRATVMREPAPVFPGRAWPSPLAEPGTCFVTLHAGPDLRGCIGNLTARDPLWRAVVDNAARAAARDDRFPRVEPAELDRIRIEVSVLSDLQALAFADPEELLVRLRPGVDGVVLEGDGHLGVFLPQVWEALPKPAQFLDHLCRKAELEADAWRRPGVQVSVFQVECFEEEP